MSLHKSCIIKYKWNDSDKIKHETGSWSETFPWVILLVLVSRLLSQSGTSAPQHQTAPQPVLGVQSVLLFRAMIPWHTKTGLQRTILSNILMTLCFTLCCERMSNQGQVVPITGVIMLTCVMKLSLSSIWLSSTLFHSWFPGFNSLLDHSTCTLPPCLNNPALRYQSMLMSPARLSLPSLVPCSGAASLVTWPATALWLHWLSCFDSVPFSLLLFKSFS